MNETQKHLIAVIKIMEGHLSKLKQLAQQESFTCSDSFMQDDDMKTIGTTARSIHHYNERLQSYARTLQEKIYNNHKTQCREKLEGK